jgi:predicted DCC family thiol-disulfide oxidoreductase YuxK
VTTAAYFVDIGGRRYRGHEAVGRFLRLCRGAWPVAGVLLTLPPFTALARAGYRLIADNRQRLPGGTAQCALPRPVSFAPSGPPGDRVVSAR